MALGCKVLNKKYCCRHEEKCGGIAVDFRYVSLCPHSVLKCEDNLGINIIMITNVPGRLQDIGYDTGSYALKINK